MSPHASDKETAGSNMAPMTDDYNKLNRSQSTVWKHAKPLFAKAIENLLQQRQEVVTKGAGGGASTFRVADLGCATGGNSVAPLSFVSSQLESFEKDIIGDGISKITTNNASISLEVFLGDLPRNSWNAVATTVTPESITIGCDNNNNERTRNTFVYMVGRTFYESCAPDASLDLSYSLVAVHWMKSYPGDIPTGLYATDPLHTTDPQLLQAWRNAGKKDFAEFAQARHRELKPGGRFIGAVAAPKANGDYPWSKVGRILYDALLSKVECPNDLASCVLPCCWRTEDDVRAGFHRNYGWEIEACEFHQTKDPVRESLEQGEIAPIEYGASVVASFKSVGHMTCVNALTKSMSSAQADEMLNMAYQEIIEIIAVDPEQYNLDVSFWYLVAKKEG